MGGFGRFVGWMVAILGAIGTFLYLAFFDVWRVPSDDPQFAVSVEPTLSAGDLVLIARHGSPSNGNLVRCTDPDEPRRFVVGRWTGDSGDTVEFQDERLFVNRTAASSPRGCLRPFQKLVNPATASEETLVCRQVEFAGMTHEVLMASEHAEGHKSAKVDPNKIWLTSDNRHMHLDSRDYGTVDPRSCQHVIFRLWGASGYGDSTHRFTIIW